jgi:hypothetical protein
VVRVKTERTYTTMCRHGADREGFYTVAVLLSCIWDSLRSLLEMPSMQDGVS